MHEGSLLYVGPLLFQSLLLKPSSLHRRVLRFGEAKAAVIAQLLLL